MDNGNQDNLISKQICLFQLVDIKKRKHQEKKNPLLIVATKKSLMHLILLIGYVVP